MTRLFLICLIVIASVTQLCLSGAFAKECCSGLNVSRDVLVKRLESANKLIPEANNLNDTALEILAEGRLLASNVTEEKASGSYQSLLNQYNDALKLYRVHRREYLEHCKKFHQPQNEPKIRSPYVPIGRLGKLKPMKLMVQDKCQQLVGLEAELLENEKKVMSMLENLIASRSKEGAGEFFNMWSSVKQLADQNQAAAIQYNHIGLQKSSQISSKIHSEIAAATRDGILSYQKEVYGKFQRTNAMENAIQRRSRMHLSFARMILYRLNALRPAQLPRQSGAGGFYSGDQLDAESQALKNEYAQVQALYRQLNLAKHGK